MTSTIQQKNPPIFFFLLHFKFDSVLKANNVTVFFNKLLIIVMRAVYRTLFMGYMHFVRYWTAPSVCVVGIIFIII